MTSKGRNVYVVGVGMTKVRETVAFGDYGYNAENLRQVFCGMVMRN